MGVCGSVCLGDVPKASRAHDNAKKQSVYTYVAEWDAPRAEWPDIEKVSASEKIAMDKTVTDGTIIGYGSYITVVHQEDQSTHESWFQVTSMANPMKALWAI